MKLKNRNLVYKFIVCLYSICILLIPASVNAEKVTPFQVALLPEDPEIQLFDGDYKVYGLKLNIFGGYNKEIWGLDIGLFGKAEKVRGLQLNLIINQAEDLKGFQIGFWNMAPKMAGIQIGILNNFFSDDFMRFEFAENYDESDYEKKGVQLGVYNRGVKFSGLQLGLVNHVDKLNGLQIGLFNITKENTPGFIPLLRFKKDF